MKIQSVQLKHFKRFTDLTIKNIPDTAKLVVMAGPNGCGKSSVFDAFHFWHNIYKQQNIGWLQEYYNKYGEDELEWNKAISITFHTPPKQGEEVQKSFYIRTAYRNDPVFKTTQLQKTTSTLTELRFQRLIHDDVTVSRNYQRLVSNAFEDIFEKTNAKVMMGDFRDYVIGDIRKSIKSVFPDLLLNELGNPLDDGTFFFAKGVSQKFDYQNLSGGEKAAFDILLDFVIKRRDYDNTVFCIDEPELHLNTGLQGDLLQEMYNLINDNSQLWIATHSIGMMRKARDLADNNPGLVTFLDFDKAFDQPQILEPVEVNRAFWEKTLHVALDDLAELVVPRRIVICEGVPRSLVPGRNEAHDAQCLDRIFSDEFPDTKFLAGVNCHEVASDKHALIGAIGALAQGAEIFSVIDRDDRSEDEIDEAVKEGIHVLTRRNLECYLFDDEVLEALCNWADQPDKKDELLDAKKLSLNDSVKKRNPQDDLKKVSGEIYNAAKRILGLTGVGNDTKSFMRSTLAPLIKQGMEPYDA